MRAVGLATAMIFDLPRLYAREGKVQTCTPGACAAGTDDLDCGTGPSVCVSGADSACSPKAVLGTSAEADAGTVFTWRHARMEGVVQPPVGHTGCGMGWSPEWLLPLLLVRHCRRATFIMEPERS
jgi:hypothetical protein